MKIVDGHGMRGTRLRCPDDGARLEWASLVEVEGRRRLRCPRCGAGYVYDVEEDSLW